jgi:hypothetical protein
MDKVNSTSLREIYNKFKKQMLKHYYIDLTNYKNLIKFLSEDSIHLDEETIQSMEKDFKQKISEIFEEFGSVFVKLNYSAAKDSDFLVHKLECFKLEEILVLLKGSNKINTNFTIFQKEDSQQNLFLILKKFYDIKQENEFRVLIHIGEIIGISQRHINIFFDYENDFLRELKTLIQDFYEKEIKPHSELFSDFVFLDVLYLDKSKKIKIIDIISEETRQLINKYSEDNDRNSDYFLLFTNWEEILKLNNSDTGDDGDKPMIKVIKSNEEIVETPENLNKFPLEIIGEGNTQNIHDIINFLSQNKDM